jgi:hypothetical protein
VDLPFRANFLNHIEYPFLADPAFGLTPVFFPFMHVILSTLWFTSFHESVMKGVSSSEFALDSSVLTTYSQTSLFYSFSYFSPHQPLQRVPIEFTLPQIDSCNTSLLLIMSIPFWRSSPAPPGALQAKSQPLLTANPVSQVFMQWLNPLLKVGYSRPIEIEGEL